MVKYPPDWDELNVAGRARLRDHLRGEGRDLVAIQVALLRDQILMLNCVETDAGAGEDAAEDRADARRDRLMAAIQDK